MGRSFSDEEKNLAEELVSVLKKDIESETTDEMTRDSVRKILELSQQGLNEEEIVKKIKDEIVMGSTNPYVRRLEKYCILC